MTAAAFTDTGLPANDVHRYAVSAVSPAGESLRSASALSAAAPAAVTGLVVVAASPNVVDLTWSAGPAGGQVVIERVRAFTAFEQVAVVPGDVTSFQDNDARDGTRYTYRLRARNVSGDSAHVSAEAITPLPAPTDLTVVGVGRDAVELSWTDNSENEQSFGVESRSPGGTYWSRLQWSLGPNRTVTSLPAQWFDTPFEIRVVATGGAGSGPSNVVTATVPTNPGGHAVTLKHSGPNGVAESGPSTITFTVDRQVAADVALTVYLHPPAGSATEGVDYTAVPRSVTIPSMARTATFPVSIINDSVFDPGEAISLWLKADAAYRIEDPGYDYAYSADVHAAVWVNEDESIDVDVDSYNDNPLQGGSPSRTDAEDAVEDVPSDDARPGKVVLVNVGDADRDGVPDYADGFDLDADDPDDNTSRGARLVPLVFELHGGDSFTTWTRSSASRTTRPTPRR